MKLLISASVSYLKRLILFKVSIKSELKELLCLASKKSYFIFNALLYNNSDGVAMVSPFGVFLANAILSSHEKNWFSSCPQGHKPVLYWLYVDNIFVFLKSNDHLQYFQELSVSMEIDRQNKFSFLDVEVFREQTYS